MTKKKTPLTAADLAWWRMQSPANPMTITAVINFAEPLPREALVQLLTREFADQPRFQQCVVDPKVGRAYWQDVAGFRVADHILPVQLPAGAGRVDLERLVSRLMTEPLPDDRPHWQCHFIENFQGGSSVVVRVHHVIGDGISLVQLLLSFAEPADLPPHPLPTSPTGAGANLHYEPQVDVPKLPTVAGSRSPTIRGEDRQGRAQSRSALKMAGGVVTSLARLADLRSDPDTSLRGELGGQKRAAWSEAIPLESVRAMGKATGGTINDVLLSAVAGALGSYLSSRRDHIEGITLRAIVPVNLRASEDVELGNKFGLVFLPLPVGEKDPVERVAATKRNMDALKQSPEALVIFGLMRALGNTAAGLMITAVKLLSRRGSAVMTNVPGPRTKLRLAGAIIDSFMFWVPQSGSVGLGVSVLSYAGSVRIGIAADAERVPDPEALVAAFHEALEDLGKAVSMPLLEPA
jgi:diacylglycerol O-acyltransferase / wax synthase